jgi:hypothetical protein
VKELISFVLLVIVLYFLAREAVELLMGDWRPERTPRLNDVEIERVFAEIRAELESGCCCDGCTYIRSVQETALTDGAS